MRFEIYEKKETEVDQPIRLRLIAEGSNILLAVVDDKGISVDRGFILRIENSGFIKRCAGVNDRLGFELDDKRQVVVKDWNPYN